MTDPVLEQIRGLARPLRTPADLDPLLERIGDARVVAIGEASHGTHEYYVLGERYDAFLYLDDTTPLQPLHLERADEHVPVGALDA
ncbi:hypothetical protein SAMN04515665_107110 [Blastococcus sp. DSM 46786]|uniref:hypothetical protein n=1 Tax=Blastococcus sp. DSM 46786 TaxID=1798227 RepID=UPI0008BB9DBC|nr:hypothetical protein [Blastococcus sp. DSM 46786]SEL01794.1 hypothetical protein SAMN04515665_107110 [Blastococcus sp. DSM 46786]